MLFGVALQGRKTDRGATDRQRVDGANLFLAARGANAEPDRSAVRNDA